MSDYYSRNEAIHLDGTPIFKSQEDEKNENEISSLLENAWGCTLGSFGKLSAIDWYAVKNGRLVGLLELKSRTHESTKFPTVFLNVRKWLALALASNGLGTPAIFVVRFTDCVKYIFLQDIDATKIKIGGLTSIKKSRNDIEPLIEVDISKMRSLDHKKK